MAGATRSGEGSLTIAARYANGLGGPGSGFGGGIPSSPFLTSLPPLGLLPAPPWSTSRLWAAATGFAGGGVGGRHGGSACTACDSQGCSVMPPSDETLRPRHTRTSYFCRFLRLRLLRRLPERLCHHLLPDRLRLRLLRLSHPQRLGCRCRTASASAASSAATRSASATAAAVLPLLRPPPPPPQLLPRPQPRVLYEGLGEVGRQAQLRSERA